MVTIAELRPTRNVNDLDLRRRFAAWFLTARFNLTGDDLESIAWSFAAPAADGDVTANCIVDMVAGEIRRRARLA